MRSRTIGVLGAAGLLVLAGAMPAAAQDESRVVNVPAGDPIKVATFGVLTGANAALGQDWLDAIRLAADERSEILGHAIDVEAQDGGCSIEGGAAAAAAIAADPTVVGVFGSACSTETVGGIEAIAGADLTTISPSATNKDFTLPDFRADNPAFAAFTRTAFSDLDQGAAVADFLYNGLGLTKVATIHDGSTYAAGLVDVFSQNFEDLGGTITGAEAVTVGQTDMNPTLTSIATGAPEAVYYPIFTAEGAFITDQIRDVAGLEDAVLIGSDGLNTTAFMEAVGPNVVGMYLSGSGFGAFTDAYPDFVERYTEFVGNPPPGPFHAQGYDAAGIMFDAIESAAVEKDDGSLDIDLGQVRSNIYATTDYPGVTGSLTCDENGQCGVNAVSVYEVSEADYENQTTPTNEVYP
jgi:branched-chain amino acid transport system substrate-binding protein